MNPKIRFLGCLMAAAPLFAVAKVDGRTTLYFGTKTSSARETVPFPGEPPIATEAQLRWMAGRDLKAMIPSKHGFITLSSVELKRGVVKEYHRRGASEAMGRALSFANEKTDVTPYRFEKMRLVLRSTRGGELAGFNLTADDLRLETGFKETRLQLSPNAVSGLKMYLESLGDLHYISALELAIDVPGETETFTLRLQRLGLLPRLIRRTFRFAADSCAAKLASEALIRELDTLGM